MKSNEPNRGAEIVSFARVRATRRPNSAHDHFADTAKVRSQQRGVDTHQTPDPDRPLTMDELLKYGYRNSGVWGYDLSDPPAGEDQRD